MHVCQPYAMLPTWGLLASDSTLAVFEEKGRKIILARVYAIVCRREITIIYSGKAGIQSRERNLTHPRMSMESEWWQQ